jgi:hypothetical protein
MSFDLLLMCWKDGGLGYFPSRIVREALDPFVTFRDGDFCKLSFPDGGGGEMFTDYEEQTNGLMINSPSGRYVYDVLYDILRQTHTTLSWSFGGGGVVADPSVIADLPEGSEDIPVVVHSGADILAEVEKT